jgi:GxxExxY protein
MEKGGKIIYPELSYRIMGVVFEVFNSLGFGYQEKVYQKALETAFTELGLEFKSQCPYKIFYKGKEIGRNFVDFIIENKVVLEIKKNGRFSRRNIEQVNQYLKVTNLKLAILINFTPQGIKYKRLINIKTK